MSVLFGATCVVGIIFMATFLFIGIWLFIVALKSFQQLRYKNYILEKIYEKLSIIASNTNSKTNDNEDIPIDLLDLEDKENISNFENLKNLK